MGRALHALGSFCARKPWIVLAGWLALLVVVLGAVGTFGAETSNDLQLPGTDSQRQQDLLQKRFPPQQNGANPIVFSIDSKKPESAKLSDQPYHDAVNKSVKALAKVDHVYSVTNPFSSAGQTAGLVSKDGRIAFAPVLLDIGSGELDAEIAQDIVDAAAPAEAAGITVVAAGSVGSELSAEGTESSELVGILAAMVILTLVLGSLVAMGLPIVTAALGLVVALGIVGLLGHLLSVPDTGDTLATMIGLGVGIDYALFLITRHQEQLKAGVEVKESIALTVATSGSAVCFAGATVVVALVALRVAGIPLLSTLGLSSAIAVLTAVIAAVTLLPALMGLLGKRINALATPKFLRRDKGEGGVWVRWSGFLSRHPLLITLLAVAALVPLIVPASSLVLGQDDIGATPKSTMQRQAYDLITKGFGVGYNGPLSVASKFDPPVQPSQEYTDKYNQAMQLKSDLDKAQTELPQQQKELEAQQATLEAQQATLEREQANLQAQAADLQAQAASLQRQKAQLEKEQQRLQAEKRHLQSQQRKLQADKSALEKQARSLAHQARALVRQLARLQARANLLEQRIADAAGDPDKQARLQARLDRVKAREAEVADRLAKVRQQAEKLPAQARALEKQAKSLARQADQLKRQAAQLQQQAAALQQQADALQRKQASLEQQGAVLKAQAAALKKQAQQLQQQANQLKQKQKQAQQEQKQAEQLQDELTDMVTAAGGDPRATDPRVVSLQEALGATSGVQTLTPPQTNKKGDVVLLSAVPTTSPASEATADLLTTVRTDVVPAANKAGGVTSYVGGYTASYADLATLISNRLLLVIGTIVLLGFVLLMVAFRSLLVPLQAAVTNVLSAAAAFGILTAAFQWGWGIDLLGIDTASDTVPIASYVPLMMFAVLFGLSMDYEVFLVSHIQQHHAKGEPARQAVLSGLRSSGRITTAACLIMTAVFASFILNGDPTIKQFGVGLASAVLLAGILVVTLAPASIALMGEAAWWLPRWLSRVLPHIDIEGGGATPPPVDELPPGEVPVPEAGGQHRSAADGSPAEDT